MSTVYDFTVKDRKGPVSPVSVTDTVNVSPSGYSTVSPVTRIVLSCRRKLSPTSPR